MRLIRPRNRRDRCGAALLLSLVTCVLLASMSAVALAVGLAARAQTEGQIARQRALYAAEACVGEAVASLYVDGAIADLGSADAPRELGQVRTWGSVVADPDDDTLFTITAVGECGIARRALEVVVVAERGGIYDNAIFAGNDGEDPLYTMKFGGTGKQADVVIGDVYSGGSLTFNGGSTIEGVPRATKGITVGTGSVVPEKGGTPAKPESGVTQPIPDIAGMDYETHNDVDVAAEFASATYKSAAAGGSAYQVPESSPAHIFRKNPSDRKANTSVTKKDDYFLEDPYEKVNSGSNASGSDATHVTLSNPKNKTPGPDGNQKVYFIDGNLWLHNLSTYSFKFYLPETEGMQVTFVVKGNIYISDNLFLLNQNKDGIAFIAMKDPAEKDSGNVYFGDPTFGTLKHMEAFLYAENNFYDNNLDEKGSAVVKLIGNMTAGNQVAINRDYGKQHSKLTVEFDERIRDGDLEMPGLPSASTGTSGVTVSLWREIGVPQ